jgi:hypothetical protein
VRGQPGPRALGSEATASEPERAERLVAVLDRGPHDVVAPLVGVDQRVDDLRPLAR